MVSSELKQVLNGESGYARELAPEPLLLPRLATRIAIESLGFTAYVASTVSNQWAPYGWSALADATAEAIASRYAELDDNLLGELCDTLPQLPPALLGFNEEAGRRTEAIIGIDAANRLRQGTGDPLFALREAVSQFFFETDPPRTSDGLMALVRERTEFESPELQRNVLAYFLPLAPAAHHQWMIPILVEVLAIYPGWAVAAAASRVAGFFGQGDIQKVVASLDSADAPWSGHARSLLAGGAAVSVFEEVTRALPYDSRLKGLFASETNTTSLVEFVDGVLDGWGGSAAAGMIPMGEPAMGEDDFPEEAPPAPAPSRGLESSTPPAMREPPPDRSLQAQVSIDDDGLLIPVKQGFKAGARHDVRLWIGPPSSHGIHADETLVEPEPDEQELEEGSMEIFVTLLHGSKPQSAKIELPLDRSKKTRAAVFSLEVETDALFVSAEVWLQHKGRIIQYLKLKGLVLEEPDNTTEGVKFRVESLVRAIPADAGGGSFETAMVKKNGKYIVFGPRGAEKTEVSLQGAGEIVEKINKKLFTATKGLVRHSAESGGTSWVDNHDEDAMQLLREMARWGNALYDALKKEGALERISETIQFVNLDEADIVPIEYVYDKGYPEDGATLCDGFRDADDWEQIFASGKCSCTNQPLVKSETLCPMGFWSLSKVIERQSRPRGMAQPGPANGFITPSGTSPAIP